jgi:hypothetical protein
MPAPTVIRKSSFLQTIDIGLRGILFDKFGDILTLESINQGVLLYPKEIALREMSEKRDNVELEFINVWRTQLAPDWSRMRTAAARHGHLMDYIDDTLTDIAVIKSIPVAMSYNVWFWTTDLEKLSLIAERYLFWQLSDPRLSLNFDIKYNLIEKTFPVRLHLHFGALSDESTIRQKYERGTIFTLMTPVTVDGLALIGTSVKTCKKIQLTFYDKDDLTEEQYSEVVVEDSNQDTELEMTLRLFRRNYEFTEEDS